MSMQHTLQKNDFPANRPWLVTPQNDLLQDTRPICSRRCKVLTVEDLQPLYFQHSNKVSRYIADYFLELIETHQAMMEYSFLLPSLSSLSEFFNVKESEVQKAFHRLKLYGHDSFMPGYYSPVSLWTSPIVPSQSPKRSWQVAFINSAPISS